MTLATTDLTTGQAVARSRSMANGHRATTQHAAPYAQNAACFPALRVDRTVPMRFTISGLPNRALQQYYRGCLTFAKQTS